MTPEKVYKLCGSAMNTVQSKLLTLEEVKNELNGNGSYAAKIKKQTSDIETKLQNYHKQLKQIFLKKTKDKREVMTYLRSQRAPGVHPGQCEGSFEFAQKAEQMKVSGAYVAL